MLSRWLVKGLTDFMRSSTFVGGKYIMMEDDPKVYINQGLLYNPDMAAVIGYVKKVAAAVPWVLKRNDDETVEDHPLYHIWEYPNPITRGSLLRQTWIEHYLATGNAYLFGLGPEGGNNAGKVKQLWNLYYDLTIEKGDNLDRPIIAYKNKFNNKEYPAEKVLHWKTSDPSGDGFFGVSPFKAGRLALQQSNDSYLANAKSLQNMGAAGILTRKDLIHGGPEQTRNLKDAWKQEQMGPENFNKLTIAQGEYEYIKFGISPVDMALLDSQVRSRQAICNILGFPSELLNDKEASTYNNFMEKRKQLYTNIIIPLVEEMAALVNDFMVKTWEEGLSFVPDWSQIPELQHNKKELVDWLERAWWVKASDKQRIIGDVEVDPEMERYYIPMNLIPDFGEVTNEDAAKEYRVEGD